MNELLEVSFKSILTATIEESVGGWVGGWQLIKAQQQNRNGEERTAM